MKSRDRSRSVPMRSSSKLVLRLPHHLTDTDRVNRYHFNFGFRTEFVSFSTETEARNGKKHRHTGRVATPACSMPDICISSRSPLTPVNLSAIPRSSHDVRFTATAGIQFYRVVRPKFSGHRHAPKTNFRSFMHQKCVAELDFFPFSRVFRLISTFHKKGEVSSHCKTFSIFCYQLK